LEEGFGLDPAGDLALKGLARPVKVVRVTRERA